MLWLICDTKLCGYFLKSSFSCESPNLSIWLLPKLLHLFAARKNIHCIMFKLIFKRFNHPKPSVSLYSRSHLWLANSNSERKQSGLGRKNSQEWKTDQFAEGFRYYVALKLGVCLTLSRQCRTKRGNLNNCEIQTLAVSWWRIATCSKSIQQNTGENNLPTQYVILY